MNKSPEKEYEFFWRMVNEYQNGYHAKVFFLMYSGLEDKTMNYVNIKEAHLRCEEIFKYLYLGKKFDELVEKSNNELSSLPTGFKLLDHTFETLDEVERALNLKAFM